MKTLTLTDTAIGQIAKLVQMAILTGTDVIDHLRQLQLCERDGLLAPTPEYSESFEENLKRMLDDANPTKDNEETND